MLKRNGQTNTYNWNIVCNFGAKITKSSQELIDTSKSVNLKLLNKWKLIA
jgi:hypothetical protein